MDNAKIVEFTVIGQLLSRAEDRRLLIGAARFLDNIEIPGAARLLRATTPCPCPHTLNRYRGGERGARRRVANT